MRSCTINSRSEDGKKKKKTGEDSHVSSLQTWSRLAHCLDGLHSPVLHKACLRKHESLQGLLFLRRHCFSSSQTLSKFLTPSGLWGNLLSHGSYSKHPNFRRMDVSVGSPLQSVEYNVITSPVGTWPQTHWTWCDLRVVPFVGFSFWNVAYTHLSDLLHLPDLLYFFD